MRFEEILEPGGFKSKFLLAMLMIVVILIDKIPTPPVLY
jgi:hypothetical protein